MIRPLLTLVVTGLLMTGPVTANQLPKSNADLEQEMAADLRERTRDPNSADARELRQVTDSQAESAK